VDSHPVQLIEGPRNLISTGRAELAGRCSIGVCTVRVMHHPVPLVPYMFLGFWERIVSFSKRSEVLVHEPIGQ
jgi:hypothetical protein